LNNIKIIRTGINVSRILSQIEKYPEDWGAQRNMENTKDLETNQPVGVLQLSIGVVEHPGQYVGNSELSTNTPLYYKHTEIIAWLKRNNLKNHSRAAFLRLEPKGEVGQHIDEGTYYLTRDRYHLAIKGKYRYTVGGESAVVEPGTFLWFNNKMMHGTEVLGEDERITFVFDIPHSRWNPQHLIKG